MRHAQANSNVHLSCHVNAAQIAQTQYIERHPRLWIYLALSSVDKRLSVRTRPRLLVRTRRTSTHMVCHPIPCHDIAVFGQAASSGQSLLASFSAVNMKNTDSLADEYFLRFSCILSACIDMPAGQAMRRTAHIRQASMKVRRFLRFYCRPLPAYLCLLQPCKCGLSASFIYDYDLLFTIRSFTRPLRRFSPFDYNHNAGMGL